MNLFHGVHEVRLFRPSGICVGYFNDWDAALRVVENEPEYKAAFFTLNPLRTLPDGIEVNPASLRSVSHAAGTSDIARRVWLLIDVDPPRPAKTNSTDAEKQAAREQAGHIREWLRSHGWPEPGLADSANGWHLLYRIGLPNDDGSTALLKNFLAHLKTRFPLVDSGNYDAPRLAKLYGSWARKGPHTEERPWRRSAVVEEGSDTVVTVEQIRALCPAPLPPAGSAQKPDDAKLASLLEFLECYDVAVRSDPREVAGGWQVEIECPWRAEHSDEARRDTVASYIAGRGFGFKCFHSHCVEKHWREFRAELERLHPEKRFSFVDEAEPVGTVGFERTALDEKKQVRNRPTYADDVWDGTVVGEFANICASDNNIPRKLYAEAFRTALGAVLGDRLSTKAVENCSPRAYTVILAPKGKGKGTAIRRAVRFFSEAWNGHVATHSGGITVGTNAPPGLLTGLRDFIWKPRGIGARNATASSVPGMVRLIQDLEDTEPSEQWGNTIPRILSVHEEMKTFFSTMFIESGVGSGMEGVVCQLWDDVEFYGTATGSRDAAYGQMQFSLLCGATPVDWFDLVSKCDAVGGGLMSRLNLIGTEGEYDNVSKLTPPDFSTLQSALFPRIQELADVPVSIGANQAAHSIVAEWVDALPDGNERLNVQAWRSALLLAWLRRRPVIDESIAVDAVRLTQYQVASHEFFRVDAADTYLAKIQAKIERALKMGGPVGRRELQRKTHADRCGTDAWDKALTGLMKDRRVGQREDGKYFPAVE